jgi:NADH:ubiquinone oxidoreductase subunit D
VAAGHPLVERMDYLSAQSNSLAFSMSVERLLGSDSRARAVDSPPHAELQRINSHLVWLGTHGMEVGAISVMLAASATRTAAPHQRDDRRLRMFTSDRRPAGRPAARIS